MKNKLSRKQPVRFDVDKLVDDFGGNTKISKNAPAKWECLFQAGSRS